MISLGISLPKQLFLMIPRMYFVSATFIFNCRNNTPLILIWMSVHHQRLRTILHLQPSDKRWAKTNWCKLIFISRDESASERRMACGFRGREEEFDCTDAAAVRRPLSTFTCKVHGRSKATYRSIHRVFVGCGGEKNCNCEHTLLPSPRSVLMSRQTMHIGRWCRAQSRDTGMDSDQSFRSKCAIN